MREKYESLSAAALKELAKARGIKYVSTMKKSEVVEAMLAEDAKEKELKEQEQKEQEQTHGKCTDVHQDLHKDGECRNKQDHWNQQDPENHLPEKF